MYVSVQMEAVPGAWCPSAVSKYRCGTQRAHAITPLGQYCQSSSPGTEAWREAKGWELPYLHETRDPVHESTEICAQVHRPSLYLRVSCVEPARSTAPRQGRWT